MNEKTKFIKECELCNSNATCLMLSCNNYFCDRCYKLIHDIKNNSVHKKESIDPFIPIDIKYPEHQKDRLNLFCVDEKGNIIFLFLFFLEICCSLCYYKNLHPDHKLIELSDIESMKKKILH